MKVFLDKILDNLTLLESGLIYHELEHQYNDPFKFKSGLKHQIKKRLITLLKAKKSKSKKGKYASLAEKKEILWTQMKKKSIGYHAFNTYAFAILKASLPGHNFWKTSSFASIAQYLYSTEFQQGIEGNTYSYAYNPPGFEVPFSLHKLQDIQEQKLLELSQFYLNRQIALTYNTEKHIFDKQTEDPITLTARIYEISRMPLALLEKIQCNIL